MKYPPHTQIFLYFCQVVYACADRKNLDKHLKVSVENEQYMPAAFLISSKKP